MQHCKIFCDLKRTKKQGLIKMGEEGLMGMARRKSGNPVLPILVNDDE